MPVGLNQTFKYALAAVLSSAIAGCAMWEQPKTEIRTDASYGMELFAENCSACHGHDARGGGAESLGLGIVPPDLTKFSKKNGGIFPRDNVMAAIDGYYRQEHLENPMPIFGEENLGEIIQVEAEGISTPIPADLLALANYLESVQTE